MDGAGSMFWLAVACGRHPRRDGSTLGARPGISRLLMAISGNSCVVESDTAERQRTQIVQS